ncbi:MAG: DUF4815 domain-containing protein [Bacilli bacterium]|nr:DUF4815 domain-containing protein [Bacilli bacterium]
MSRQFPAPPYFDDFATNKDFYKILFRPGYALQCRELNQIQSILQNQIESIGSHLFKDGSMIIPGYISISNSIQCIKIQSTNNILQKVSTFLLDFIGTTITGTTSGATALVIHAEPEIDSDYNTLYIKYITSGDTSPIFLDNEVITNDADSQLVCTTLITNSAAVGSLATIQKGIYFIKGYFVLVDKETIILDKYGVTPSYKVGLTITENIITSDDDNTLNDNAIGSYNYTAPGAHRYSISTSLSKLSLTDENDTNFLELLRVNEGNLELKVITTDYAIIEETLARRTYDESGDYTVNPFKLQLKEDRNNDRGERKSNTPYVQGDVISYEFGGSTYTYTCISSGTSGISNPTYIYTFGTFTDGSVTWEYTETPIYNLGVNLPENLTNPGNIDIYDIAIEGGKAYVGGHEIEKIGVSNIRVDKARDFKRVNNTNLTTKVGNFVRIYNMYSAPEINFPTVQLYDRYISTPGATPSGNNVGTAMLYAIEPDGTIANAYKAFLFNINLLAGKTFDMDVKQIYYNNTTTLSLDFTADVYPTLTKLTGSITAGTTDVTGVGTLFNLELTAGDYITADKINYYRVSSIATDVGLTLSSSAASPAITGSAFYVTRSTIIEPNNIPATVKFDNPFVRKVKSANDTSNDTNYTITRKYPNLLSNGSGIITITLSVVGETFASIENSTNYLFINNTTGATIVPTLALNGSSTVLTVSGLSNGIYYNITTAIDKTASERSKTLNIGTKDVTTQGGVQKTLIILDKVDGYRLLSVKMAPSFGTITSGNLATIDITTDFDFSGGQRNSHYDVASISLKPGHFQPTGSIRIFFEYFTHGAGDYFSVDSYNNVIPYNNIPSIIRDSLDFRPIMNNAGTSFNNTTSGIIKRGYNISADYSFYLSRIDTLSINKSGDFFITKGVSDVSPVVPNTSKTSMLLAVLRMQPYTIDVTSNSIAIELIDNKRYTMRDIGALEKRISNLEYYTSLSMLEQETKSLSIIDDNGLERFKNGFIVDSFSDHGIGDVNSEDYKCSIDINTQELRPQHNVRNVTLFEYNVNDTQRLSNSYQLTGDIITLPYIDEKFVEQPYASRVKNLNPYATYTFIGNTSFNPSSDNWFDTKYAPDVVVKKEGNFLSTQATLNAVGVLGTQWGAWEQTWTGSYKVPNSKTLVLRHGIYSTSGGYVEQQQWSDDWTTNVRNGTFNPNATLKEVTISTTTSTREGIKTAVTAKFDNTEIDDKIISTSVIPYMRKINILFLARGLKPKTIFYPFFDDVDISEFIIPATKLTIESVAGYSKVFNYTTNVGASQAEAARLYGNDVDITFNKGDVVTGSLSGATGIVSLQEDLTSGVTHIYINNIKGTFILNENISGSISSSVAKITSIVIGSFGQTLKSNTNGDITGVFRVPNSDRRRFRTGDREFTLTTQPDKSSNFTSIARAFFTSSGLLNTRQKTIESVRNAIVTQERVSDNKTVSTRSVNTITSWYDPLAQTFLVTQASGIFLTRVDVYFASKDNNIPVRLEIREVVNGYPGSLILPFSQIILTPDKINLSNISVIDPIDKKTYMGDDTPTSFIFPSPVYVKGNTEYCVVLISDSNNYNVWISQLGDKQINSDRYISEQPYAGVLFDSQNASTWTANQLQDLKFVIYRSKFDINTDGNVEFVNSILPYDDLISNPIQTTNGSNIVRIYQSNHGMINTDKVTIKGIATATYNNIPSTELNATHIIDNADLDSYTITTTTSANVTGMTGGEDIKATFNAKYDSIHPTIQTLEFPEATIEYDVKTTSVASVLDSTASSITVDNTIDIDSSSIVASQINETYKMSGDKSFKLYARLHSSSDTISPVIDTNRTSLICINNKINDPTIALNIDPIDYRAIATTSSVITVDDTTNRFETSDSSMKELFATIVPGKYITVTGCNVTGNNGVHLVTDVDAAGAYIQVATQLIVGETSTSITIVVGDYYIDEIAANNSSSSSKYITKNVSLENQSTSFKLLFAYNKPIESNIDVYYKIGSNTALNAFNKKNYSLLTNDGLKSTSDTTTYVDAEYEASGLPAFTVIKVKVVLRSTDTSKVPKIKDFRLVALA